MNMNKLVSPKLSPLDRPTYNQSHLHTSEEKKKKKGRYAGGSKFVANKRRQHKLAQSIPISIATLKSPTVEAKLNEEPTHCTQPDLKPSIVNDSFELPKVIVEKQHILQKNNLSFFDISQSHTSSR